MKLKKNRYNCILSGSVLDLKRELLGNHFIFWLPDIFRYRRDAAISTAAIAAVAAANVASAFDMCNVNCLCK